MRRKRNQSTAAAQKIMKERNYNLELIRMSAFLMVIAIHVTNYFCRAYGEVTTGEYLFSLVIDTLSRVSVPCFFMLTGALLLGRDEPLRKHIKRLLHFFLALVVWSLVYYLWNVYYMGTEYDLRRILYMPTEAHLWYLYAMIPIYFVLPFFQVMCRNMDLTMERAFLVVITAAVIFNYIVALQDGEAYYDIPIIGDRIYSYFVFIGYYLYKYRKHIKISQRMTAAVFAVCMAAAFGITWGVTVLTGEHYERALEYGSPFLVLAGAAFFLFVIRLKKSEFNPSEKAKNIIDLICGCSFGIYLIHILFLDNYKKHMEPTDLSAWIAVPALIISIAAASFICVWLLRKTSIGRKVA